MASDVYTLPELVDLALKTPEIGAVNFNILRIILHKILVECKLQNVTGEWKPVSLSPAAYMIEEDKLPHHPLLRRIAEEKEKASIGSAGATEHTEEERTDESEEEISLDEDKGIYEIEASEIYVDKTVIHETPETDIKKTEKVEALKKPIKKKDVEEKEKEKPQTSATYSPKVTESNWFYFWKQKKLVKRIDAIEDELNTIVETVDDLWSWKEAKTKRFQEIEGEIESGYSGPTVGREEFEDTVEELSEMLTLLRSTQKEQQEKMNAANQDIVKEMQLMATQEEMKQSKDELNKKLNTLSKAIAAIQEIIKEVIYPETCGTSKCLFCKRKAHLPLSGMAIDLKDSVKNSNKCSNAADLKKKPGLDPCKRTIRKVNGRGSNKSPQELTFTTACLKRLIGEDGMREMFEEKSSEDFQPGENAMHSEKSIVTKHLVSLEAFEIPNLITDFAPMRSFPDTKRRDCVYVPSIRSKREPLSIPVGSIKT